MDGKLESSRKVVAADRWQDSDNGVGPEHPVRQSLKCSIATHRQKHAMFLRKRLPSHRFKFGGAAGFDKLGRDLERFKQIAHARQIGPSWTAPGCGIHKHQSRNMA